MKRYNGVNQPFICSSCPRQKTFGDCHSLLIHSVLTHDKSFVMDMHNQASKRTIENSVVNELEPVPLIQQNLKGPASSKKRKLDKTSPKSARKSPRLGQIKDSYPSIRIPHPNAQCQYCDQFFPNLDCLQSHILVKHCEHCKFCNMMIQGNFEDHLHNSHYKQKLESVVPKETRCCSGKYVFILPFSDNT